MRDLGEIRFFRELPRREVLKRAFFALLVTLALGAAAVSFLNAIRWIDRPFPGFLLSRRMVNGGVGQYHWTGTQAGIRYLDKVLRADGRDVRSMKDVEAVVTSRKVGEPVTYSVRRGEQVIVMAIPTMRFTLSDFLLIYGTYFLYGISCLVLGTAVFIMKPDTRMSSAAFVAGFFASVFGFANFDIHTSQTWMSGVWVLAACLVNASLVHLTLLFPKEKRFVERWPFVQAVPYLVSLPLALATVWTFPSDLSAMLYRAVTTYGAVVASVALVVSVLHAWFIASSAIARQRAKVVLLGGVVSYPIPTILGLVASSAGGAFGKIAGQSNYLLFTGLFFAFTVAYAIARHNLFDVDVYIKRTVGYGIMTALVGVSYFAVQLLVKTVLLGPIFGDAAEKLYPLLFAFLVVFLFNPVNRRVQGIVDRVFFRKKFDYKETVLAVSGALASVLNLDEIVRRILHTVRQEMFIDATGLVLVGAGGKGRQTFFFSGSQGMEVSTLQEDPLVSLVTAEKRMITKYDVAEDPHYRKVRESCGKRFEELEASLAVPLVYQGEVKAVMAVGHKKSGQFFTREDVELLGTLASQGAVAIENANLAEQMKKEEAVRTNLSRYLSPQIVERIVHHDVEVNLGGDRKVVTVLFSDIRNFTTITETRPPDQLVRILNEYFTEMAQVIFENQGSLDKYIGDAIVAVFGSLIPLENPAKNAVSAAVAMMKRLPELNRRWEARYEFYMNIGIGVNTGEVFLGNIGSPERMEFTVIGDAVNVASRFSGLAKPGQILVTKETMAQLGADFPVREHPPAEVKGKSGKLEVFEIRYTQAAI